MKKKLLKVVIPMFLVALILTLSFAISAAAETTEIVYVDSSTVWKYIDDNTDPAEGLSSLTAWTLPDFDDSKWKSASGSFGSKNGSLGSVSGCGTPKTLIALYPDSSSTNVIPAYFFRTSFSVEDASVISTLNFSLKADDAVVVYLNGNMILDSRKTIPEGAAASNLYYASYTAAAQDFWLSADEIGNYLLDGENTLAVELHNNQKSSTDIYFEMSSVVATVLSGDVEEISSVVLGVGSDETERGLVWYSPSSTAGEVQYAPVGSDRSVFPSEYKTAKATATVATNKAGYYSNKATLVDILEECEYVYRIVSNGETSELYYFNTGDADSYNFVFLGDPQFSNEKYSAAWADTLDKVDASFDADFIISAGDQINNASAEDEYDLFILDALAEIPFAPSVGPSHDDPSAAYSEHFYTPNLSTEYGVTVTSADYWYTYGDVLFMHLNMADKTALESEHKAFMTEAMRANPDVSWNIVVLHTALFTAGMHSDPEYKYYEDEIGKYREILAPQLTELGIDVVLGGHDHVYVRSHLMNGVEVSDDVVVNSTVTNPKGTLHLAASSSTGSKFYDSTVPDAYYSAYQNDEHRKSATVFSVTEGTLTMKSYFLDTMTVFDSFTIYKSESDKPLDFDIDKKAEIDFEEIEIGDLLSASTITGNSAALDGLTFHIGGRTGVVTGAMGTDGNKYVVITQTDKAGASGPYVYVNLGDRASVSGGTLNKSNNDISNYKYMVYEIDVMAPSGKFLDMSISPYYAYIPDGSTSNNFWYTDAVKNLIQLRNDSNGSYIRPAFDTSKKLYINPYEFTHIQVITENTSTTVDGVYTLGLTAHVYVNGEYWFSKEATSFTDSSGNTVSYYNGEPHASYYQFRFSYSAKDDPDATLALDNLKCYTVSADSEKAVSDLISYDGESRPAGIARLYEYVSGGKTVYAFEGTTLADVISLADPGSTVKLLSDISILQETKNSYISINKKITLDLNGKTLAAMGHGSAVKSPLFYLESSAELTVISSVEGGKIFNQGFNDSSVGANGVFQSISDNAKLRINGRNAEGAHTLAIFSGTLILGYSNALEYHIDGGVYVCNVGDQQAFIDVRRAGADASIKNALFMSKHGGGIIAYPGRNTETDSEASVIVDSCIVLGKLTEYVVSPVVITVTNTYVYGAVNAKTHKSYATTTEGKTNTVGTVVLGVGNFISGDIADTVTYADGCELYECAEGEEITKKFTYLAHTWAYDIEKFEFDSSSFTVTTKTNSYKFGKYTAKSAIKVTYKDSEGNIIGEGIGFPGAEVSIPEDLKPTESVVKGWIASVPDEWCEPTLIPEDATEYTLTEKVGGKVRYVADVQLLFNISLSTHFKYQLYVPELEEGIEVIAVNFRGDRLARYNALINTKYVLGGETYTMVDSWPGLVNTVSETSAAGITFTYNGEAFSVESKINMVKYCDYILNSGEDYSEAAKRLAVNAANYIYAGCILAGKESSAEKIKYIVDENQSRLILPAEEELVSPDVSKIIKYVSSVQIVISATGPRFRFNLTEEGRASDIKLSTGIIALADDEVELYGSGSAGQRAKWQALGYVETDNTYISKINSTTITVTPADGEAVSLTYNLANYVKALSGVDEKVDALILAMYGYARADEEY